MNRMKTIVWSASIGVALGAGMMYLLDPDRGRRRRAFAHEKGASMVRHASRAVSKMARDLQNRTRGAAAHARQSHQPVDDDVLVGRVRTRLGRLVEHPHKVDVTARNGVVTLRGIVERREYDHVISAIRCVEGVKSLEHRLTEATPAR